jgi:hypothetical protein
MYRKLKNWLQSYMEYTEETESTKLFNRWVGLSALASALRRKVWFNFGRIKICPNLFVVLVAEPGVARKTQAIGYAEDILSEIPGVILSADSSTPAALLDDIESAQCEDQFADGTTLLHNSLTIVSGEFESFLGNKKDNQRMITLLTDFFDCKTRPFKYRTKHSGSNIINAVFLNLIAATTPGSLASILPYTAIGGGLTARIIFAWSEGIEKKVDVPETSPELEELKQALIHDLSIIARLTGGYNFTKESRNWWREWYNTYDVRDTNRICKDPSLIPWYARKHAFLLKVGQLVASSYTNEKRVSVADFESALLFIEDAEKTMGRTFSAIGRSTVTAEVDLLMQTIRQYKVISEKQLMQILWRDIDDKKFDTVMGTALKTGFVKRFYRDPQGNPGIWYRWEVSVKDECDS